MGTSLTKTHRSLCQNWINVKIFEFFTRFLSSHVLVDKDRRVGHCEVPHSDRLSQIFDEAKIYCYEETLADLS